MTSEPRRLPKWTKVFLPNKDVAVTPILISINVIVWLLMLASGVDWFNPTPQDVYRWGATESEAIRHGEYWRLLVSNYLHAGILHIGVNMLSLNNIGRGLEQFIGKWRFAILYTVTGIFASAVSVWWHTDVVGVGASGAIVGIVGVLTALLTTNLIERTARFKMLRSIGISLLLMIAIGMNAGIDNAAHFGGLLAGLLGGYFIFPEVRKWYYERKQKYIGLIAAAIVIVAGTVILATHASASSGRTVNQMMEEFWLKDNFAQQKFNTRDWYDIDSIQVHIIPIYENGLRQLDTIESLDLNDQAAEQFRRTRVYMNSKLNFYRFMFMNEDSAIKWLQLSDTAEKRILKP